MKSQSNNTYLKSATNVWVFYGWLSFYFFSSAATNICAQTMKGLVVDQKNKDPLPAVYISNTSQRQITLSNADGHYSISVKQGDQVTFSYVGYYPKTIVVSNSVEDSLNVALERKPFTLETVDIRPDWTPYQLDSLKRRQKYNLDLNRQKVSSSVLGSVLSPASALAEQFSKKSKQRFRFQKNFTKWEAQHFVDTRYKAEDVAVLTGLNGDSLATFMNAHPIPYDFARVATDLEIKMWIRHNYKIWSRKNEKRPNEDSTKRATAPSGE